MIRNILIFLTFFAIAPASFGQAISTPIDAIVAIVDEDVILRSELDQAISRIRRQYQGREAQLPPGEVLERQVLERLMLIRLQLQRAESTGVRVTDTEVDEAIGRIAQQNQLTFAQLQAQLERDGFELGEFRRTLRDELLVQKLRQRVVETRADVSPSEVEIALASGIHRKGEVRLSAILVSIPDGATPEQVELAKTKIDGVKKLIDEGKIDFTAAAIRYSDAAQALEGGDLGWRRYDQVPPAFGELVAGMNVGEISQPMRTPTGYYLIQLTDKRDTSQIMVTEFRARKIQVSITELQTADAAERDIEAIHARLEKGDDFEKLARELSEDESTAPLGGDMGWFPIDSVAPQFAEMLTALDDGAYTRPFRDSQGWVIMQRVGSRQSDRTDEVVRNQIRESLRQRKGEEAYENFLRQLRGEAFIEDRLAKS
jgi:peptidyl-prolyl cis-trans isomerase SurA